jgi:hypothetical protein
MLVIAQLSSDSNSVFQSVYLDEALEVTSVMQIYYAKM